MISWIVSAQRGNAISQKENRIVVQEDGYYLVFGQVLCHSNSSRTKLIMHMICSNQLGNVLLNLQVLFESPSIVMGHVVRSRASAEAELLRCLQAMPDRYPANTCYTAGQWETAAVEVFLLLDTGALCNTQRCSFLYLSRSNRHIFENVTLFLESGSLVLISSSTFLFLDTILK